MKRERKPILKNKVKRYKKPKNLFVKILAVLFFGMAVLYAKNIVPPMIQSNQINIALNYYGANSNYLGKSFMSVGYRKFCPKDTKHIKVGYSSNITDEQLQQFNYYYDYLNSVFEIINPNYHFETGKSDKLNDCDIYVEFTPFSKMGKIGDKIVAFVDYKEAILDYNKIKKDIIYFDSEKDFSKAELRFYMAHEMLHALTGNEDIGLGTDLPMTVFGYKSLNEIIYNVENYRNYKSYEENKEIQDEFITYMPYDLSALISLYGNIKDEQNRNNCISLLKDTLKTCQEVLYDEGKYFEDEYILPDTNIENEEDDFSF